MKLALNVAIDVFKRYAMEKGAERDGKWSAVFPVSGSRIPAKSKAADHFPSLSAPFFMAKYSQS